MSHTARPASNNPGARIAWDLFTARRPDVPIKKIWYFRAGDGNGDPDYSSWMVEYEDGEFDDEDYLVIRHLKAERVIKQLNAKLGNN